MHIVFCTIGFYFPYYNINYSVEDIQATFVWMIVLFIIFENTIYFALISNQYFLKRRMISLTRTGLIEKTQ